MRKVSFICDTSLDKQLDKLEQIADRSSLVNHLIRSYGLNSKLIVLKNVLAKEEELLSFHSTDYINHLKYLNDVKDIENHEENLEEYGLGYDCPLIHNIFDYVSAVVGSSVTAAHSLVNGSADFAINWYGGWHHAQRDEARGFCYANDIVCAINVLRQKFPRVFYIDLDIHHGDGVENAFAFTPNVLTFSLHKYELGFYPGSGAITDVGRGNGKFYSVNVPLKDGIRDESYSKIFDRLSNTLLHAFDPDAIVIQCGCDSLAGDPLGTFNLTLRGYGHCIKTILSWQKPTLFLGGGGYNVTNAARCWTYLTSFILDCNIPTDIPDNLYFERYGPGFDLDVAQGNRPDRNSKDYIDSCIKIITENASNIKRIC